MIPIKANPRFLIPLILVFVTFICPIISAEDEDKDFTSQETIIAENILFHQRDNGGWPKNYNRTVKLTEKDKQRLIKEKKLTDTTIDNSATHFEVRFMAKAYNVTKDICYKEAFLKGVEFILRAQYENGGWPQFYPTPEEGYQTHITFNDGAMIGVMTVLRDIAQDKTSYSFVDDELRERAETAVEKGIQCILKCQILVNGKKTAWCSQHDEKTFASRKARTYELVSLSGSDSVGILNFLMSIDNPGPEIIDAIQNAVIWFNDAKLEGIRLITVEDKFKPRGWDRIVIKDPSASPMWARFYEIGTNKPIFASRDGVQRNTIAEISYERRMGYHWLGYYGEDLLDRDYPAWQKKWAPDNNVLNK